MKRLFASRHTFPESLKPSKMEIKMKKFKAFLALVATLSFTAFASIAEAQTLPDYVKTVSVSSSNTTTTPTLSFGTPTSVLIANDGATTIFADFGRAAVASSTTAYQIKSCQQLRLNTDPLVFRTIGLITTSGTSTAQITVGYQKGTYPQVPSTADRFKIEANPACSLTSGIGPTANGASWLPYVDTELITLSTVGLTTDSSADLLHANSLIDAVVCRQTTAITTSTAWGLSDPTTANRFSIATAIATPTIVGLFQWHPDGAAAANGPVQVAAAKLRITVTVANAGAGVVRCSVFGRSAVPPTS